MMEQLGYDELERRRAFLRKRIEEALGEEAKAELDEIDRRIEEKSKQSSVNVEFKRALAAKEIERYNAREGNLAGYDCKKCKNRGDFMVPCGDGVAIRFCECKKVRDAQRNLRKSGLANALKSMNFESFDAKEPYAKTMYESAKAFLKEDAAWFYVGGQVGSGKTHICTAMCGELLENGREVIYMLWKDEATRLKGIVNDSDYPEEVGKYKRCEVLYIDDLFKPVGEEGRVSDAELKLLFEIINSRYVGKRRTIISSERTLGDLMSLDEATGSRIYQMSKGYQLSISKGGWKNRRISGGVKL